MSGRLGGGPPLHCAVLRCGRSPRLPNGELARQAELGVSGGQPGHHPWLTKCWPEEAKGRGGLGLPTVLSERAKARLRPGAPRREQAFPACLGCYSHHTPGHLPQGGYCCSCCFLFLLSGYEALQGQAIAVSSPFSLCSGGSGEVVSRPGQPRQRQN